MINGLVHNTFDSSKPFFPFFRPTYEYTTARCQLVSVQEPGSGMGFLPPTYVATAEIHLMVLSRNGCRTTPAV